jgi:hypothetical protein
MPLLGGRLAVPFSRETLQGEAVVDERISIGGRRPDVNARG